jgi:hypothetical protein
MAEVKLYMWLAMSGVAHAFFSTDASDDYGRGYYFVRDMDQ